MKQFRRMGLSLVLAIVLLVSFTVPAMATNPTVAITVTAQVVSITNSQNTWALGTVAPSATVKWGDSDTYSTITNTGTVNVDVAIQGQDIEGGDYDWTLAADGTPGSEIYGLKATTGTEYNVIVKKTPFNNITTNLPHTSSNTVTWSMTFYGPTAFNAADNGAQKTSTVTLVASASA
jgi:hypothetical protein